MIELKRLHKSYGKLTALRDVSLVIKSGDIFGIIGKSGAGKSTLLRSINLLETPDSGEVIIDNETITQAAPHQLRSVRHKMAMIFQHFNLLQSKTVYENIALPMHIQGMEKSFIKAKIEELLVLVELEDKAQAYPSQLSGGQKQRVAIARALSCSPKILLCDEATSALDPETTRAILELLKKINRRYGITIVLITHEMDVIKRICHRLAVMDAGAIIETTSLATLFDHKTSPAQSIIYKQLCPPLPDCLINSLSKEPNTKPLLRLFFQGDNATVPFISHASRDLAIDINILLANIDRFDGVTCGVLIVELNATNEMLNRFIQRCEDAKLIVEILGYVTDDTL